MQDQILDDINMRIESLEKRLENRELHEGASILDRLKPYQNLQNLYWTKLNYLMEKEREKRDDRKN